MREICTSGSVRGGAGDIPTYSAIKIDHPATMPDIIAICKEAAMTGGLDGLVVAETVLSEVDGANGRLIIRGAPLQRLANHVSFAELVHRLFVGFFDSLPDPSELAARLGAARAEAFESFMADDALVELPPLDAVRALTARLQDGDDFDTALRLLAAPAVFLPAVLRLRAGDSPIAPEPPADHARDILRMTGAAATHREARALDTYLVTVAEHGLNASTFAARVVASTRAGLTSSVLAGMSALKGPLHGGAPGPVIDMLDAIASPARAAEWLEAALDRGDRLMGFGHRIYRVRDPRADALKAAVRALSSDGDGRGGRLAFAEAIESAALEILRGRKPERRLETNVEFYTALILEALGFPSIAFTGVFAIGRTAGWIAHAREQALSGRLIRPQSRYIGPEPPLAA
jgi:citrate synthase